VLALGKVDEQELYDALDWLLALSFVSMERGLMIAMGVACGGIGGAAWSLWQWAAVDFGPLTSPAVMRVLNLSLVLIATGVQLAFTFFLLGIIDLPVRDKRRA
jgi:hypothetical protein